MYWSKKKKAATRGGPAKSGERQKRKGDRKEESKAPCRGERIRVRSGGKNKEKVCQGTDEQRTKQQKKRVKGKRSGKKRGESTTNKTPSKRKHYYQMKNGERFAWLVWWGLKKGVERQTGASGKGLTCGKKKDR